MTKAPIITCARHRMGIDGQGVTTLVCFHGCPLRCAWCINPFSFAPDTRRDELTPRTLYHRVKVDELYFLATGGGITFGGGEPLLHPGFLKEFRELCGPDWHLCAETSLAVPWESVALTAGCIDTFYIDCKDTDPQIYRLYTGQDNALMLQNLEKLLALTGPDRLVLRLPLIPGYNTEADRESSFALLSKMGIKHFDRFTYRTPETVPADG